MPPLTLLTVANEGPAVTATWLPWVTSAVTNYQLSVLTATTGGTTVTASVNDPFASSGRILVPALAKGAALTVTAFNGTIVVAQSSAVLLPLGRPSPNSVRYDPTALTVSAIWSPAAGAFQSYSVTLLDEEVVLATTSIANPVATAGSVTLTAPLAQNAEYTIVIAANTTSGTTLVSGTASLPLLTTVPQLLSADYDGVSVRATWAPFATSSPAVRSWTLRVSNKGAGTIQSLTVTGPTATSATMQLQNPLPTGNDVVCEVAASPDGVVLSASPPLQLLNTTPTLLSAISDGSRISATWMPVAAPRIPVTTYTVAATSAATGVSYTAVINNPAASNGVLPIPVPLSPSDQFSFSVSANTGVGTSSSASVPVVGTLPAITATAYQPTSLSVQWTPASAAPVTLTGYSITVFSSSGLPVATAAVSGAGTSNGSVPLTAPLTASPPYTVRVSTTSAATAAATAAMASSPPAVLMTPVVTVQNVAYDGQQVTATWSVTGAPRPVAGFTLIVTPGGGGTPLAATVFGGTATSGTIAASSLPAGSTVTVVAHADAVTSGQSAPAAMLVTLPSLISCTYDGATVAAVWTPAGGGGIATYTLRLLSSSGAILATTTIQNPVATNGVLTLTAPLPAATPVFLQICANAAAAQACTAPVPLVVQLTRLSAVVVDPAVVSAVWEPVSGDFAGITEIDILVIDGAGAVRFRGRIFDPNATSGSVAVTFVEATYTVRISAIAGNRTSALGPARTLSTAAAGTPSLRYDGSTVLLSATPSTASGVTGYACEIATGGTIVGAATIEGQPSSGNVVAAIPFVATPGVSYSVALRALLGIVACPKGSATLLSGVPGITAIVTTPSNVTVTLDTSSAAQGFLYESGKLVAGPVAASSGSITFPFVVTPQASYTVQAQLATATVSGPLGAALPVVSAVPQFIGLTVSGTTALLTWTPVADPDVTGYAVTLNQTGGASTTSNTNGTSIVLTVDPTKSYTVAVQALANIAAGVSATASLITESVAVTHAAYDGALLTLTWAAAATSGASYIAQVISGGAVVASLPAGGTTAVIPLLLGAAASYSAQVLVVKGIATGPAGTALALLTAIPSITAITTSATNVVVTLGSGSAAQGFLLESGNVVAGPVAASSGSITFPFVVAPQASYTVPAQLATATVSGPLGAALPVVSAVPQFTGLTVSGTTAQLTWAPVADPDVTGYAVTLNQTGGASTTSNTNGTSIVLTVDPTKSYTVAVQALANIAAGVSATASLITESVAVTHAAYDGALLTLTWAAAATSGASYIAQVISGGAVVASLPAGGTTAVIPLLLGAGASYSAQVLVVKGIATGPAGTALALITTIPTITAVSAGASAVTVTLDVASGARASLYEGGVLVAGPVAAADSTVTLPFAVLPQSFYTVSAQSFTASASGPVSAQVPVISAAPAIVDSDYDGTSVLAAWTTVAQPGVTGYQLTVTDTTSSQPVKTFVTPSTEAAVAVALALSDTYEISVQAIGDGTTGPKSAAANPLANSVGYFFPAKSSSNFAYLFRGDIRGPAQNSITLYLPQLFGTPPASITNDPFVLTKLTSPPVASLPYTLTLTNTPINVWSITANGIREALRLAYIAFLQKVEAPANQLLPGAMALLRQVIAQALPLTFAETLYYSYGFNPTAGYVNLQPGMRLRVDFENHQFVNPDPTGNLTGFVGAGTSYLPVSTIAGSTEPSVFDAFLGSMPLPIVAANTGGGAGVIDLQGSRFQMAYLRLIYPPTFPSSDSGGATGPAQNAVILGAPTIAALESATTFYLANRNFIGLTGIVWTYFRGRATMIPEAACLVNGTPVYVSVGTTVRQLTETFAALPFNEAVTMRGFAYRRPIGNVVDAAAEISPDYPYGRSNDVHFSFQTLDNYVYSANLDLFDLPVLGGDWLELEE
jgi:hypothetical protein